MEKFSTIKLNKGVSKQLPEKLQILIERNNAWVEYYYENLKNYKEAIENHDLLQYRYVNYADCSFTFRESHEFKTMCDNASVYSKNAEKSHSYIKLARDILQSNFNYLEWFLDGYNSVVQNKLKMIFDDKTCEYALVET